MSRFAKNFHLTCAIAASLTCIVWLTVFGLVFYWHSTSSYFDPAKITVVLVPALVVGLGAVMEFSFYNNERKGKASVGDDSLVGKVGRRLLTSRLEILAAMGVTALLLVQSLSRGPNASWKVSQWLSLHGWFEIVLNCALCWLGFLFIRETSGRERIFLVGGVSGFFLWPLGKLWPESAMPIRYITVSGLVTALLVAVSLLLRPSDPTHSDSTDEV